MYAYVYNIYIYIYIHIHIYVHICVLTRADGGERSEMVRCRCAPPAPPPEQFAHALRLTPRTPRKRRAEPIHTSCADSLRLLSTRGAVPGSPALSPTSRGLSLRELDARLAGRSRGLASWVASQSAETRLSPRRSPRRRQPRCSLFPQPATARSGTRRRPLPPAESRAGHRAANFSAKVRLHRGMFSALLGEPPCHLGGSLPPCGEGSDKGRSLRNPIPAPEIGRVQRQVREQHVHTGKSTSTYNFTPM